MQSIAMKPICTATTTILTTTSIQTTTLTSSPCHTSLANFNAVLPIATTTTTTTTSTTTTTIPVASSPQAMVTSTNNICNDIFTILPNFAIVRIPERGDIIKLFTLLLSNGFPEVSFVNEIRENAFLPVINSTINMRDFVDDNRRISDSNEAIENSVILSNEDESRSSPAASSSTPPTFINTTTTNSSTTIPSPIPFVARPRGSRATTSNDPTLYAICQLCQNKIMSSRLSNLTNHVRRHASLKQFQCVYCIYTHNEMAKVRLHMQHNHKDHHSQPLDALTPEMQNQWELLMEQCFPGYSKMERSERSSSKSDGIKSEIKQQHGKNSDKIPDYACIECGEHVQFESLADHLENMHKDDCIPYSCEECGYLNADQWKIRLHITLKHSEKAAEVNVMQLNAGSNLQVFLHKYFPKIPADEEEILMLKQFQNIPSMDEQILSQISKDNDHTINDHSIGDVSGITQINCELCRKEMSDNRSLSSLMNHARRHYHLKQYQCSECTYTSSEAAHVRTHMAIKHPHVGAKPIDNNATLQNAWIEIMRKCFPDLVSRIDHFRFNNTAENESASRNRSSETKLTGSRTKRKSVMKIRYSVSPPRKHSKTQNAVE